MTHSATYDTELSIRGRPEWEMPTTQTISWKSKKWRVESDQNIINLQHFDSVRPQSHRCRDRFLTLWQPPDIWGKKWIFSDEWLDVAGSLSNAHLCKPRYQSVSLPWYSPVCREKWVFCSLLANYCWRLLLLEWNWSECSVALKSSLQFLWS